MNGVSRLGGRQAAKGRIRKARFYMPKRDVQKNRRMPSPITK